MGGLFGKRDSGGGGRDDIEDLRVPPPSASASPPPPPPPPVGPFAGTNGSPVGGLRLPLGPPAGGPLAGLSPKDIMALAATGAGGGGLGLPGGPAGPLPGPMGSALLDTYLSMIAAAGGGGGEGGGGAAGAMASALQSFGRFGAAAAAKHNASGNYHVKHDLLNSRTCQSSMAASYLQAGHTTAMGRTKTCRTMSKWTKVLVLQHFQ